MARNAAKAVEDTGTQRKRGTGSKTTAGTKAKKQNTKKTAAKPASDKKTKKTVQPTQAEVQKRTLEDISPYANEVIGIVFAGAGLLLGSFLLIDNPDRKVAAALKAFMMHLFGIGSVLIPVLLIVAGVLIFMNKSIVKNKLKAWACAGGVVSVLSLAHIIAREDGTVYGSASAFIRDSFLNGGSSNGGLVGAMFGGTLVRLIDKVPSCIVFILLTVICIIIIFDFSVFNAMRSLAELISYRSEYDDYPDDEQEYEKPAKQAAKRQRPQETEYILSQYDEEDEKPQKRKSRDKIFTKRPERPVLEAQKFGRDTEPEAEEEPKEPVFNPYHTDSAGRVVGIDLPGTKSASAQPIKLYPAGTPAEKYDPNDDESDINALFTEDSEEEYENLLREASDLFEDTEEEEMMLNAAEHAPSAVQSMPEKPPVTVQEDTPPWEEQPDKPQIIQAEAVKEVNKLNVTQTQTYRFPKIEFLGINKSSNKKQTEAEMIEKGEALRKTLAIFGVDARVDNICTGPAVTRYELIPKEGTRVQSILKLEQDIALSLAATTVRIEAPIPGKSAIGIEIPNDTVQSVYYSEVLRTDKFQNFKSKVAFGIGKDIAGNVVVYDIAKAPHMLIAGATGAGKSVCINTLITSILYKATPEEVRLIMVDPKVVELSVYNGIPHLLIPVVTDPKKASGALNWAVGEMMRRYDLLAESGTRKLEEYNKHVAPEERLPLIVIIIDELADLMMVAKKEVEDSICRIAQLARVAGIHLIIATQRPSVDVLTGLIKANVPTRIAFKVSSGTDSRTVLDTVGAEKLLGRGDMLFKPVDNPKPLRVQGAFVTDDEVKTIVEYIKTDTPNYDESVMEQIEKAQQEAEDGETSIESSDSDELIDQVIDFIVQTKKASASAIQRKFRIGFNRAGRIIDELEERGIIGPENGSKPREVLMSPYERREYKERHENY
ncbi:MAG: DNA translocase FtsK [Firmicutes bacterium]|nr:DNA translocase FtsK [Bacillota bacterium]